jgi:hypothetical protein
MLYQVSLDTLVIADNFYRKLAQTPDFQLLSKAYSKQYGYEGKEHFDPIIFFEILQLGYFNYINGD